MVLKNDSERLGLSFVASLLIHFIIILIIAAYAGLRDKETADEDKWFVVDLFDRQRSEAGTAKQTEATHNLKKFSKPDAEIAPKIKQEQSLKARNSAPIEAEKAGLTANEKHLEKEVTAGAKEMSLNRLIPSYRQLGAPEVKIDDKEVKYLLIDKINRLRKYPEAARTMGIRGKVPLHLRLNRDGSIREIRVIKSSGYALLDSDAIAAVKDAAPFDDIVKYGRYTFEFQMHYD